MPAMRAPIKPIERPKQQEGKIISWDLNHGDPARPKSKRKTLSQQMADQLIRLSFNAGYPTPNKDIVYALVALQIPKGPAKEILSEIYEADGHSKTRAEQMAEKLIDISWDSAVKRLTYTRNRKDRPRKN